MFKSALLGLWRFFFLGDGGRWVRCHFCEGRGSFWVTALEAGKLPAGLARKRECPCCGGLKWEWRRAS